MAKTNKRKQKQAKAPARQAAEAPTRRSLLSRIAVTGLGAAAIGGGGWAVVEDFRATAAEHDLTRIGQGAAKVVQIHDPQCPICARLQREARAAVEELDDDGLCFLVANIRTPKGRGFASRHGVQHITLVLFDRDGAVVDILIGDRSRDELAGRFRRLIA